jgi:cAMP-dependent protein kinase regulator
VVNRFAGRRKSVFAEQYDPEEDEEEDNNKVIFPKTDEQRTRLSDSVKNILLFRALDPEQVMRAIPYRHLTLDTLRGRAN